ncbi:DNA polymerase III subunit alpha [Candidatus Campbellbacteria bacterium]|nr:MAG: DNA polymerase III subunit alpha [Candidatus Campbellbacteria bacterium]
MTAPFVHLHTHSHYSLLSALPKIKKLVARAVELQMPALALTDNGNMYGAIEFYKACLKAEIKPILGVDFYVAARTRHDKEPGIDAKRDRLVLLAMNDVGYKNLIKLVTYSHTEGFYYRPRVDRELLQKYHEGLIAILPIFNGPLSNALRNNDTERLNTTFSFYLETFGKENIYLEITHHPDVDGHEALVQKVIAFGKETNTPLIASNDVHYLSPDDMMARKTLLSIQSGSDFRGGGFTSSEADFSFLSPDEMQKLFKDTPEALENTLNIADRCHIDIPLGSWMFPNLALPEGATYESELRTRVDEGFTRRELTKTPEIQQRLDFELDTIISKGYAPYFLVVGDLLAYAREHKILTNTRGSVAGSLVSYVLGITTVNPLEYQLPFERFLNPLRPSPPDIDLDIADNKRDTMIAYAREKYGADNVAQIGTFGTMMARGAVRDTARALGFDYAIGDQIAKLIPMGSQGFPMSLDRAMKDEKDLKALYDRDEDAQRIIDMAKKIEGCARHISVHAAGVVISPIPLVEIVPTQFDPKGEGKLLTQYDMHAVEDVGLLKFDFLGLKNLAILSEAIRRVRKIYGIEIDVETLPIDDKETYDMLARGDTMAVFQLSGQAMTQFLKELRPSNIHDINAMVALYRPGPMNNIPEYIARKHGKKPVIYMHPKMKNFLERSHGILVYQDDLMSTALELAGYTWETVDKFRKAIGKKIPEEMAKQHVIFVEGCVKNSGMTTTQAEDMWKLFEPFQGYGFNKAHAASYGRLAYQTAYMKAHYPTAYMAAVLSADAGDVEKISELIAGCVAMGIEVLPPDINESFGAFSVVTKDLTTDDTEKIRFGLYSIKNLGEGISDVIIEERKQHGPYESLENFLDRIHDRNLNKKSLEALIQSGSLDRFGERGHMLANVSTLLAFNKESSARGKAQDSLFGGVESPFTSHMRLEDAPAATQAQKLAWEKALLGLYISGHPLDVHKAFLEKVPTNVEKIKTLPSGMTSVIYGLVEDVRPIMTKKNEKMAFVHISDYTGTLELVLFPKVYEEYKNLLVVGSCVGVKGKISLRNGEISMLADKVKPLGDGLGTPPPLQKIAE